MRGIALIRLLMVGVMLVPLCGELAAAQDHAGPPTDDAIAPRADDHADIYIDDSFEAAELFERARRLSDRNRWIEAARLIDRAVVRFGDKLVRIAPRHYGPVGNQARELIAAWPDAGLAVYREQFERQARQAFEAALPARDAGQLHRLLERYYCTATGIDAADTLAQLAIEAGEFESAAELYDDLLRHHPDVRRSPKVVAARMAVVSALLGREDAAQRWAEQASRTAELHWMGQTRPLADVIAELRAHPPTVASGDVPFVWPTFGGAGERNRMVSFRVDEAASLWRVDQAGGGMYAAPTENVSLGYERAWESGTFLTMNPVVARGLIFIHNALQARAIRADTGAVVWSYHPVADNDQWAIDVESATARWHGASYSRGWIFAVFGDDTVSYYSDPRTGSPSILVCLDAATGVEVWRSDGSELEESFSRHVFDPTPLVVDDKVFVVVRRRRTFGFEDCYLCRFDAHTGAMEFRTHLGGASAGGFGFRRPTMTIPTLLGSAIVLSTNLGTVAAVNRRSGRVRWLSLYDRETASSSWGGGGSKAAAPWYFNPVLAEGGHVICRPLDAKGVLVLDSATGEPAEGELSGVPDSVSSILGLRDGVLYGVADEVFAYDLSAGEIRWSAPLPKGERPYGRGLLTEDRVLVPTRARLCGYTLSGEVGESIPWEFPEDAGNVLALPDRLIIVGNDRISAYARKGEVWASLRERMAASPADPLPALDMCEVALRGGDTKEAVTALEQAVERGGGFTAILDPELKRRLFDNSLTLADRTANADPPRLITAVRLLGYAAQCAPDIAGEITYRMRLADLHDRTDNPRAAVEVYQQMIADRSLRDAPADDSDETAGTISRRRIERLIHQHGRDIYAGFDATAGEWLDAGARSGDRALLERVVEVYPNAEAALPALIDVGGLLRAEGRPIEAARRLSAAYSRYQERSEAPEAMRVIADCYADANQPEAAWAWLSKAARRFPTATLETDGMRLSFREYRALLGDLADRLRPSRPRLTLPLSKPYVRRFDNSCHLLEPPRPAHPSTVWDGYYVYTNATVQLFDAADNTPRWDTPAACRMKPDLLLASERLAVFASRHQVFALDPRDGRRVWEYGKYPADLGGELTDHEMFAAFRVHAVGPDYVLSFQDTGLMACLDLASGRPRWERIGEPRATGPVAMSHLWAAYAATRQGDDICRVVDLGTGETLSIIQAPGVRRAERVFSALENLVVLTAHSIHAYDPFTGEQLWESDRGRLILAETVAVDLEGVYFSDDGRHMTKLDIERGRQVWQSDRLPFRFADGLSAVLHDDQLIVSTEKGINALDAFDGRVTWAATIPHAALLGKRWLTDDHVAAVDTSLSGPERTYTAYFFDRETGTADDALDLGAINDAAQIVVRDGAIMIATEHAIHAWCSE